MQAAGAYTTCHARRCISREASVSRCAVAAEPCHSSTVSRIAGGTQPRSRQRQSGRPNRRTTSWLDVEVPMPDMQLSSWLATTTTSHQQDVQLHPAQLTALIQRCTSFSELSGIAQLYGGAFNEVHVMCAISRLSNLQRRGHNTKRHHSLRQVGGPEASVAEVSSADMQLLEHLLQFAVPHMHRSTPRILSTILSSLARLPYPPPPSPSSSAAGSQHRSSTASSANSHTELASAATSVNISQSWAVSTSWTARSVPGGTTLHRGLEYSGVQGQVYWAVVHQLVSRSVEVLHAADADQGCHILWAAAKLGCLRTDLLVAAAKSAVNGCWRDNNGATRVTASTWQRPPAPGSISVSSISRQLSDGQELAMAAGSNQLVAPTLRPMLLWSLAHSSATQLQQPSVQQLLRILLDPTGGPGSIIHPACLHVLPLRDLVTALYALGLVQDTARGSSGSTSIDSGGDGSEEEAHSSDKTSSSHDGNAGSRFESADHFSQLSDVYGRTMPATDVSGDKCAAASMLVPVSPAVVDALCNALLLCARTESGPDTTVGNFGRYRSSEPHSKESAAANTMQACLHGALSPRAISNTLLALSRLQHRYDALIAHLVTQAEQVLAASLQQHQHQQQAGSALGFSIQEVCNMVMALPQLQIHCPSLLQQLGRWLVLHAHRLGARDVGELLYSLAMLQQQQDRQQPQLGRLPGVQFRAQPLQQPAGQSVTAGLTTLNGGSGTWRGLADDAPTAATSSLTAESHDSVPVVPLEAVQALADAGYKHLEQYSPRHLVGLLWDLSRLGCPHAGISSRIAATLLQQAQANDTDKFSNSNSKSASDHSSTALAPADHLHTSVSSGPSPQVLPEGMLLPLAQLEPDEMSRLCCALAAPQGLALEGGERTLVLDLVAAEATEWCHCMSAEELVVALEAFAHLQHPCPALLEAACGRATLLAADMLPALLVRLAWCLACLEAICRDTGGLVGVAARDLLQQLAAGPLSSPGPARTLPRRDVIKLCWTYAFANMQLGAQLLEDMSAVLCQEARQLSPCDLGSVCWALVRLRAPSAALQQLAGAAMGLMAQQDQQQASQQAQHMQHHQQGHGRQHSHSYHGQQLQRPLEHQQRQPPSTTVQPLVQARTLATIAFSLAQRRALPGQLLSAIVRESLRQASELRGSDAAQVLWALSTVIVHGGLRQNTRLLHAVSILADAVVGELTAVTAAGPGAAGSQAMAAGAGMASAVPEPDAASLVGHPAEAGTGHALQHRQQQRLGAGMAPSMVCLFVAACGALEYHPGEGALQAAARKVLPHVSVLSSRSLCHLLSALVLFRAGQTGDCAQPASTFTGVISRVTDDQGQSLGASQTPALAAAAAAHAEGATSNCGPGHAPGEARASQPAIQVMTARQCSHQASEVEHLLASVREVLTRRLCFDQLEVLSLGHMVRLAWALSCRTDLWYSTRTDVGLAKAMRARRGRLRRAAALHSDESGRPKGRWRRARRRPVRATGSVKPKHIIPRLLMHAAARAFAAAPASLAGRPLLQRQLEETRLLLQAECQPRSTWRALKRRWEARVARAQQEGPGGAVAAHGAKGDAQEQQCAAQVTNCLNKLDVADDIRWGRMAQGDNICVFRAWPDELKHMVQEAQLPYSQMLATDNGAVPASRASPPVTFALYIISSQHLSCNASRQELASSALRVRLLRRRGYKVLAVHASEWLTLGGQAQEQLLLRALMQAIWP